VLFLDEPTTGLDPSGRQDLWGVIEDLVRDGTTLLLTTQYLEEADRLADNIVVIDHGSVIAEGTAAQLKERMGSTVIEITLRDDDGAARAADALVPVGTASRDGKLIRVNVPGGAGARSMLEAVRILDGEHLDPATMVLREPTLDDVFLDLTGHTTADSDEGEGS
jgi:ABC-2 type transport system ATP-binding protein